jgi:hypothetical protein
VSKGRRRWPKDEDPCWCGRRHQRWVSVPVVFGGDCVHERTVRFRFPVCDVHGELSSWPGDPYGELLAVVSARPPVCAICAGQSPGGLLAEVVLPGQDPPRGRGQN